MLACLCPPADIHRPWRERWYQRSLPFSMNEDALRQQDEDRRLLAACANGDPRAFAALYDRLSGPLHGLCLRMTGEPAEAEDIIQEAFLTIWRRAGAYDSARGSVFNWAVHLTRCKIIDHLRARGRRLRVIAPAADTSGSDSDEHPPVEPAAPNPTAGEAADQRAWAGRVRRGLEELPADQGRVIEMAFFSDLTHHEISARLGQPLGTVKARIRRGLLRLRAMPKTNRTRRRSTRSGCSTPTRRRRANAPWRPTANCARWPMTSARRQPPWRKRRRSRPRRG
jgi:RNA polymerase sigma-70 factor, ECF subfamily